jgi:Kdo2-lipid IVA lauroyltransferase/acyltransferase
MLFLLRWLSRRSLRHLHALGALAGWLAWALSPSYRRRQLANAQRAGVSRAEQRAAVAEAGRMMAEMPRLWLRPAGQPIADPVQWDGDSLIESAIAAGRGAVILTPHLGSFELVAQAYAERFGSRQPVTVLYRPARKAALRELEETARARPFLATAPATLGGVRQLMRALRRGETVGLLPDQVPPEGMGVWAPFFGQPAYTMTLAAKLVRQTGAALLAIWGERLPQGRGYRIEVLEMPVPLPAPGALPADENAALLADATAINRSMEALIARKPSQYLWGYNRYKNPRQPVPA